MTNQQATASTIIYARIAGLAYIVVIFLGIFSVNLVESNLIVAGNDAATANDFMASEIQFRIGIASELIMFVLVVLLSWALYVVLKTVNQNLALIALLWRVGEAILGSSIAVVSGLIPLLLLNGDAAFETEQLHALVGLFLEVRNAGLDFVLVFIGLGGTVFCYLFYKSNYVPRILAAWGILTYLSMLILSLASILLPNFPEPMKMIVYAPGGLFEIIFGFWLLIKGVKIPEIKKVQN